MKETIRKDDVMDNFFGVEVADPYRWLEDETLPDTKKWTEMQNERTRALLDSQAEKDSINKRLKELYNYEKYSTPEKKGNYYYFFKNDGLQNQPVFYRTLSLEDDVYEVVLDPNQLNDEGTAAIMNITFNHDGTLMTYAVSYNGSDWEDVKIKDLKTGEDFPETVKWCKFSSFAWSEDSSGFFYNRYPDPSTVNPGEDSYYNRLYFHRVNTSQTEDELIYEEPDRKERIFYPSITDDQQYLILHVTGGTEPINEIYYKHLTESDSFIPLIENIPAYFTFLGNDGNTFYFETNDGAPKGKVISVDLESPAQKNWKDTISEKEVPIAFSKMVNDKLIVCTMHDAHYKMTIYEKDGSLRNELPLPDFITINDVKGTSISPEMFISYTSFLSPLKVLKYDFETGELTNVFGKEGAVATERFETKQVFYPSKDGTKIPMFLTYKKGLVLDGNNPVLLYGYGGYTVCVTPSYSPSQRMWIDQGGIYAVANIRGGGEYGQEWHRAALFEKRQNSFDDFIGAAEYLIGENYTNSKKIAIMGASNGGLLVGACITQRPELFGAALCLVPVTDMLRFHRFTVGRFWTTEFGNAEQSEREFKFLYSYSPLHNVKQGTEYPPTLISTADTDDRVVPLHAKKFAAALQEAQSGSNPIILRVEKNAGHGQGKPLSKVIEEDVDLYTFLFKELKIDYKESQL